MLLLAAGLLASSQHHTHYTNDDLSLKSSTLPPAQTTVQKQVVENWIAKAKPLSANARPRLLTELNNTAFRKAVATLPHEIASKSVDELLKMLNYEIYVAPVIHNVPLTKFLAQHVSPSSVRHSMTAFSSSSSPSSSSTAVSSSTPTLKADMETVMSLGYMPTIWQLIANGSIQYDEKKSRGLDQCEINVLKYPAITLPKPTMKEAYDRPVYNALNLWKRSGGNFEFGEVALVLNEANISNKTFWSPVDTGWYCAGCLYKSQHDEDGDNEGNENGDGNEGKGVQVRERGRGRGGDNCKAWDHASFGDHTAWYHLLMPHLEFWGPYLSDLFKRWYDPKGPLPGDNKHLYMEGELSGALLVPDVVKYVCLQYVLFHSKGGNNVQNWAKKRQRPLLWARDYNSAMVVDPFVDQLYGDYKPTTNDVNTFWSLWDTTGTTWATFLYTINPHLQVAYLNYFNQEACTAASQCTSGKCKFIGVNPDGKCIYWR